MDGAGPRDVGRRIGSGLFLASPAFAALAMYWLADAHLAVVAVIAVAAVTLRPIHTGPIVRTAVVVFALSPATAMIVSFYRWIADTVTGIWASIGTLHILIRFPAYAAFALAVVVVALVFQAVAGALVAQPLFNIIERESRARQRRRDAAAATIVAALRSGCRAAFSLYLRPFDTTAQLSSNLIGTSVSGASGNIQTDFEAILASAFPAHRPLIALGTPGALLPTKPQNGWTQVGIDRTWDIPGSGKLAISEEDWRDTVALLAREAELILIVPLQFTGTLWEIEYVCTHDLLSKCVFIMPVSVGQERDYTEAWRAIGPVLSQAGIDPPAYDLSGRLLFLEDGAWRSTSSFVRAPVPRATALLLRFAQLRRRLGTSRHPPIQTAT